MAHSETDLDVILQIILKHEVFRILDSGQHRMIDLRNIEDAPIKLGSYKCIKVEPSGADSFVATYKAFQSRSPRENVSSPLIAVIHEMIGKPRSKMKCLQHLSRCLVARVNIIFPIATYDKAEDDECQILKLAKAESGEMISQYAKLFSHTCEACKMVKYGSITSNIRGKMFHKHNNK